ncbi:MAG: tripartite tricarboxylate transporter TctB family protein [Pseudomonadota bacterium]
MLKAESLIALALMGLSIYFMVHATVLPITWVPGSGPGGGAFPFWLSFIMLGTASAIFVKSLLAEGTGLPFFDPETLKSVLLVAGSVVVTIALITFVGAYVAFALFLTWYLRFYGRHSWALTGTLTASTLVFVFVFFEATLRILLPKGVTEPFFVAFIYPLAF